MYSILTTKILLHYTYNRCWSSLFTVEDSTPRRGPKKSNVFEVFVEKPASKTPHETASCRWESNFVKLETQVIQQTQTAETGDTTDTNWRHR
jgi:hypothetical protein